MLAASRENELSFGRPNWFNRVKEEHTACRENVALFDMSAFVKLEVEVGANDYGFLYKLHYIDFTTLFTFLANSIFATKGM